MKENFNRKVSFLEDYLRWFAESAKIVVGNFVTVPVIVIVVAVVDVVRLAVAILAVDLMLLVAVFVLS